MAALKPEVQLFIVRALACFDTPSQVVNSVKEEFGLTISRQAAQAYDPDKHGGRNLSKKWRVIFENTRKKFLTDTDAIPIANQTFRLRTLNRMLVTAADRGNVVVAAQLMEQAAKEIGGAYTNRQKLEHDVNPEGALAAFMAQIGSNPNSRLKVK